MVPSEIDNLFFPISVVGLLIAMAPFGIAAAALLIGGVRLAIATRNKIEAPEPALPAGLDIKTARRRKLKVPLPSAQIAGETFRYTRWATAVAYGEAFLGLLFTILLAAGVVSLAMTDARIAKAIWFVLVIILGILAIAALALAIVLLVGTGAALLWIAHAAALVLAYLIRPASAKTEVETSKDAIRVKVPLRRSCTIPWSSISRIDVISWGDGTWDARIAVRIYWDNQDITLGDLVELKPEILAKLGSIPGFSATYHYAFSYEAKSPFVCMFGKNFTAYQRSP